MKTSEDKFQVISKDAKLAQPPSNGNNLQKRSTSDSIAGVNLDREALNLRPVPPLSEQISQLNSLKKLKKDFRSKGVILKSYYKVFLTIVKSLKTGIFTSVKNFGELSLKNISGFLMEEVLKNFLMYTFHLPRIHLSQVFSATSSMRQRLRKRSLESRDYRTLIWDQNQGENLIEQFIAILDKFSNLLEVTQKNFEDQNDDSTISGQMNLAIVCTMLAFNIFLALGYVTLPQATRTLKICKDICKRFHSNDIEMLPKMSFVMIQTLIHIELLVQDELLHPLHDQKSLNLPSQLDEIYTNLLYSSHITLAAFKSAGDDDSPDSYDLKNLDREKFCYYVSIFNDLVLSREKAKVPKSALQLHPILLVHQDSNFSEFGVLSKIIQELRDTSGYITEMEQIDTKMGKLDTDYLYDDQNDNWVMDVEQELKTEGQLQLWAIFEQRLEFLAQALSEHDFESHREEYCKMKTFLAEEQIVQVALRLIEIFQKSKDNQNESFAQKLTYLCELCFKIIIDSGRNNPCAIEQLLTPVQLKYFERIYEKSSLEIWFTLYGMISSHSGQEEVFTMGYNQMLRLGHFLINLSTQIDESEPSEAERFSKTNSRGMLLYFAAATLFEFTKRIDDNIRTQQDKIQILKKENPDDKFDSFEVDVLGLTQLKLKMVQATENFTEKVFEMYFKASESIGEFLDQEDNMEKLTWGQMGFQRLQGRLAIHDIRGLKTYQDFKEFREWRGTVADFLMELKTSSQSENEFGEEAGEAAVIFFTKESVDLLAMAILKCQEARNLVRKTAKIEVDDNKISRTDEYLDADKRELERIIEVYNRCNLKSRHHEILWQIIKEMHKRLDFDDPSRSWIEIVTMVMDNFNIFDQEGRRMTWSMGQDELRRKKAHMLRYIDEVLLNVLFAVLHSGRGFFDLETRKMDMELNHGFSVFTFDIIQKMLGAVKMAVGGIMKYDPVKLDLDGKLIDFEKLEEKIKKEGEKLEKKIEDQKNAKKEQKQKAKEAILQGEGDQSVAEHLSGEDENEEENELDEIEGEIQKRVFEKTARFDVIIEYLTVLNKYHDDDAIFSQKLWLKEKMLEVQESWIRFMLKAKRGVKMRRENLKKPFKDLYQGGDEPLVFDLPDDLLGEFGADFSMMNTSQDVKQLYEQVDRKNFETIAKKTMQLSQAIRYTEPLQNFYSKHQQFFSEGQQESSFKDYYARFPEHIFLSIKFQLQRIHYFTKVETKYKEYYDFDHIYKKGEATEMFHILSPVKQAFWILTQMLEHHTAETQLLIFMLCCPDKDLSTGDLIVEKEDHMKGKNSLKALTLGLYAEKLTMLTDSNLKYTMFLKRRKDEGKGLQDDDAEGITRDNYWMQLTGNDESSEESFIYLYKSSSISRTFAMYNQTIMVSSLDQLSQLQLAEKRELNKFLRNLCENNCLFFKDFFFNAPMKRGETSEDIKFSTYLMDLLIEFILFFNKDKRFLGYWAGKNDQLIFRHKLFQRNKVLINFFKHVLYLITEIMDGLITNFSVESQLIFDRFLEKLVTNESYMGLVEIVDFLFTIDFSKQTMCEESKNNAQGEGQLECQHPAGQNKISDLSLEAGQEQAKKQQTLVNSKRSNMIEMLDQTQDAALKSGGANEFHLNSIGYSQPEKLESELLSEINLIRQGFLRLVTLPLKNKMTKNNFFAENLITLVDFEKELNENVVALVGFINQKIYRTSGSNLVSDDDFLTLYKGNPKFRSNDLFKECSILIQLVLALSDINITLEKKRKIMGIVMILKKYGLKSPGDRDLEVIESYLTDHTLTRQTKEFLQFIAKVICRIEILVPQNQMVSTERENRIILFENPPHTFFLQNERKDEYLDIVDQENPRQDLMKYSGVLLLDMDQNFHLYERSSLRYYFLQDSSVTLQKQLIWCFSLLINLACLVTYKLSEASGQNDRDERKLDSESWKWVVNIASFVLAGYSLILLILWLMFKMPIQFEIAKELYFLSTASMRGKELGFWIKAAFVYHTFTYEQAMINMIFHVIFGILGPLLDPFFHALHLLLFVNISSSAMYILKASTNRLGLLINTLFMAIFVIFAYSILTANYYSDKFGDLDDKNIDACATLASCFLYSFSIGLQSPIGDKMAPYDYATESKFGLKLVFDITFFIFINTIILNMVFGIITDAFGEMRDKSYERMENIENTCLICQNKRGNIEEANVNFKNHIHTDHAYFLYVNFIKYIKEKDQRNFTADEVCVFRDIDAGKVDWMPLSKSLYLEGMEEDEDLQKERLYDQVASIEKGTKSVAQKLELLLTKADFK